MTNLYILYIFTVDYNNREMGKTKKIKVQAVREDLQIKADTREHAEYIRDRLESIGIRSEIEEENRY